MSCGIPALAMAITLQTVLILCFTIIKRNKAIPKERRGLAILTGYHSLLHYHLSHDVPVAHLGDSFVSATHSGYFTSQTGGSLMENRGPLWLLTVDTWYPAKPPYLCALSWALLPDRIWPSAVCADPFP